jgi:hypothetical protein
MSWLRQIAQRFENTSYWGRSFLQENPDFVGGYDVYQSPNFPHVFLGGEDDLDEAEAKAGQSMCKIVDCRDLPEIDAENTSWDFDFYSTVKFQFDKKVEHVVSLIQSANCPIFVHCAAGINRSVSVLAAALAILTNQSIDTILADMKKSRMMVGPQDPYYLMALEASPSEQSGVREQRFLELDQDFPLVQPGLPVEPSPFNRTFASSNWLFRLANQDLANEFNTRWQAISDQKSQIAKALFEQNPPQSYYEQLQQDAEALRQVMPLRQQALEWMETQTSLIQDPGFLKRWTGQIEYLRQMAQTDQEQIQESQAPWNPSDHSLDDVLEWATDTGLDIIPILDEYSVEYEEVEFPKAKVLVFETAKGTYVHENGYITEAHEWVNDAEPLDYYEPEPDDHFWQGNLQGYVVYHATSSENAESIMREGLAETDDTRGIANRSTGSAVFTSESPDDISAYGDVVIAIDVGAMQADGYMPYVAKEEPIEEQQWKESLAHQLGLEDYYWEVDSDISPTTLIFYGAIPAKYLSVG